MTRRTSSMIVLPAKTLLKPSCNMVVMPFCIATRFNSDDGARARIASRGSVDFTTFSQHIAVSEQRETFPFVIADFTGRLASLTQFSHEPLAYGETQRGGDEKIFRLHVEEAWNGRRGVVGVERGKKQMPRECRVDTN